MQINAFTNSLFSSVSYLLIDGNSAWIVDIGDADSIIQYINNNNLSLKGIMLTHGHFDHIYGLNDIVTSFPTVPVYTNEFGAQMLVSAKLNMSKYHETPFEFQYPENIVILGGETKIGPFDVYETPGQSPSCLTFVTDEAVFTGDAYIPGIAVVTNLPKGNKVQAQQSVQKILDLASGKTIYPGHKLP
jgi:glyoxylase-like metal-dependent hydrolase (beta-lactamase superfamily II)